MSRLFLLPLALLLACDGATADVDDDDDDGGGEVGGGLGGTDGDDTGVAGEDDGGSDGSSDDGGETGGTDDGSESGGDDGSDEGGDDASDEGGDSGDGDDGEPAAPIPVEGSWTVTSSTVSSDPCSLSTYQDPTEFIPTDMTVTHTDVLTFELDADGTPSDCEMGDLDFTCEESSFSQSLGDFGLDGSLDFTQALSGELDDTYEAFAGVTDMEVTCSGSDCYLLEFVGLSFPCELAIDMDVQAD